MSGQIEPLFNVIESYLKEALKQISKLQERIENVCKNILGCQWDCDADNCALAFYWHRLDEVRERISEALVEISREETEEERKNE